MKLLSLLIFIILVGIGSVAAQPSPTPTPIPKPINPAFRKILEADDEAVKIITANYISGGSLDRDKLTTDSLNFLLQSLDPHSGYLDVQASEEFRVRMNSQFFGIGSALNQVRDTKGEILGVFIRETISGGPSERAGLRFGDEIVEIDGLSMRGKDFDEVRSHLIGQRGTKVIVVVERRGVAIRNEIIRDAIPTPSIPDAYMIRPGIGYIAMTQGLTRTTHAEFVASLNKLKSAGMKALVLDIRDNSGGIAQQACLSVSEFIPYGETIFTTKGRAKDGSADCVSQKKDPDIQTPIVAMINENTASSAEFVSAGLQDTDRAFFVGENTFGKGLLQQVFELEGGRRLHLTTSRFIAASRRAPQRDYSDGSLYRYYADAGSVTETTPAAIAKRPAFKTVTGRTLYGGGGITPDEIVRRVAIDQGLAKWRGGLSSVIFSFTRRLAAGNVAGLEKYRIDGPAVHDHELSDADLAITDDVFKAFRSFAVDEYKLDPVRIDRDRSFLEGRLRTELVTAAYGSTVAKRLTDKTDAQLLHAIESISNAKLLLERSMSARNEAK